MASLTEAIVLTLYEQPEQRRAMQDSRRRREAAQRGSPEQGPQSEG